MRIIFIGPPGAGKGTQSERLVQHLRIPHLSTGEMLRQARQLDSDVGLEAARYMDAGKLVPDPIIMKLIEARMSQPDCQDGCLLDGFPRTVGQAEALDRYLKRRHMPIDLVLELKVDPNELMRRLTSRKRGDDKPEVIRQRLEGYVAQTQPLIAYYRDLGLLAVIDGIGNQDQVFERIKDALDWRRKQLDRVGVGSHP